MAIRAVSHVAIGVSDMDRALRFYRDALGLVVSRDTTQEFPAYGEVPAAHRRAVYLRWRDGADESFVVLDQHDREDRPSPRKFYDVGIHHYGFWVDDVDAIVHRARSLGEEIVAGPLESDSADYGEATGKVIRGALLRDPDGNYVQLDQRRAIA
jgi:catechol 2,3-dioxygenase-like lactoylglutathione lyase family enzyme